MRSAHWPARVVVAALAMAVLTGLIAAAFAAHARLLAAAFAGGLVWALLDARASVTAVPVRPRNTRLWMLLVASVAIGVSLPTLSVDFLGDDFGYVRLFHDKPWASFVRLGDISEGLWGQPLDELRPLFALSFKLGLLLHGPHAGGFHATNLLLHALCCLLLMDLLLVVTGGRQLTAAAAALLFAVMPVHSEAVAWITGKVDLLPTAFYLATLGAFARFRGGCGRRFWWLALALYLPALFTKEIMVTLPAVLVAFDLLVTTPGAMAMRARLSDLLRVHLPFALAAGGFLALRALVFDNAARAGRITLPRLLLFFEAQPGKLAALLAPFDVTIGVGGALVVVLLALLLGAALRLFLRWREHAQALSLLAFAAAWYALTLLPLLVTYSSARHLYLPSCGVATALALLLLPPRGRGPERLVHAGGLRLASVGLLVVAQAVQLVRVNAEWTTAGATSLRLRTQIAAALEQTPADATLLLSGLPVTDGDVVLWKFALPFALQPPFVPRDLYAGRRVLAPQGAWSRPLADWWSNTRAVLVDLLRGEEGQPVDLLLLHWNERRGALSMRQARPTRALLRRQVLRALGALPHDVETLDPPRADRLIAALAEAARHSPAVP